MRKARYICIEGTEGVGKTTQTQNLVDFLRSKGYKVLQTKEPGVAHQPLTMALRAIMLDKQYDEQLTRPARELISQAIRSIHLEKLVVPGFEEYDFIVQDRGLLSGVAYGVACGNTEDWIHSLIKQVTPLNSDEAWPYYIYDDVVYLKGDTKKYLEVAKSAKQEFAAGDAIEAKGTSFMLTVQSNMDKYSGWFKAKTIQVDGKNIDQVFKEILSSLTIEE